jgi:DNA-binding NarL/FixJ family response regulator
VTIRTDAISEEEWDILRWSPGLSLLQTEIVRRLFCGKSHHEIAREMAIRPRTVRTQTDRLYREFGVSNRVQLVLHVLASLRECWEERESLHV